MRKLLLLGLFLLVTAFSNLEAQVQKINLNIIEREINGGLPIPAEDQFTVTGAVPERIEMVKLTFSHPKNPQKMHLTISGKLLSDIRMKNFRFLWKNL